MALNDLQERFCKAVALEGLTQVQAYSKVYDVANAAPATIKNNAYRLAAIPEVRERIVVLKERATAAAVEKASISLADSMAEARRMMDGAEQAGQFSAGVAAAKLRAQLAGHLDEKKEKSATDLEAFTPAQLAQLRVDLDATIARAQDALSMTGEAAPEASKSALRRVVNG